METTFHAYAASDYAANPGKYRLYKTATIARHIFTLDGEDDLSPGDVVGLTFFVDAWNQLHKRMEPVYLVCKDGRTWGHVYANNLADFVL